MLEAKVDVHRLVDSSQQQMLFIEANGLYVSWQKNRRKAREEKILAIRTRKGDRVSETLMYKVLTDLRGL